MIIDDSMPEVSDDYYERCRQEDLAGMLEQLAVQLRGGSRSIAGACTRLHTIISAFESFG